MDPVLSIITGTLNRRESFQRLLRSVQERTEVPWEMVVSDASDDPLYTSSLPENVRVILERPRQGCVKGYNRAFSQARGKWVLWLNDDAEVMPGYSKAAVDFMEQHPEIGLGCLYYCENTLPYLINIYKRNMVYANFGILSRELGEKIGWFDDVVTMYGCDNSLAYRVLLAGKGIGSIQKARVWHHVILDQWKVDNQRHRSPDSRALGTKYDPLLNQMEEVYNRTKHLIGPLRLEE